LGFRKRVSGSSDRGYPELSSGGIIGHCDAHRPTGDANNIGVPIILTTKAGGAGALGADFVANAKPDGHTIGAFSFVALTSTPQFNKSVSYKYRDFTPISTITVDPCVLVSKPDAPGRILTNWWIMPKRIREN